MQKSRGHHFIFINQPDIRMHGRIESLVKKKYFPIYADDHIIILHN